MSVRKRHGPKVKALIRLISSAMFISASMMLLCHTNQIGQASAAEDSAMLGTFNEPLYESIRKGNEEESSSSPYRFGDRYSTSHAKSSIVKSRSIAVEFMRPFLMAPRLESASLAIRNEKLSNGSSVADDSSTLTMGSHGRRYVQEIDATRNVNKTKEPNSLVDSEPSPIYWKLLQHDEGSDRNKSTTNKTAMIRPRALPREDSVTTSESKQIERNSECALILKRTYILTDPNSDEWGEKFVFNEVDEDNKRIHKSDLCIKYADVERSFEEAKHMVKFEKPDDLNSFDVADKSIGSMGELTLSAASLLSKKFDLSKDEILNALPMIDMSSMMVFGKDMCPKVVRPVKCSKTRYRTITGHCNNLKHSSWGASKTPYARYLPPDYADGLDKPRAGRKGEPLPSARLISSTVHAESMEPSRDYSILFADWGQLLNHDVTRAAPGEAPDCCPHHLKGLCMPIHVPESDPVYSQFNVKCLKFDRSLAATRPKCLLGPRAQINTVTSLVDASFVYGSTKSQAAKLRSFEDGQMKVMNYFYDKFKLNLKPLLPPQLEQPDQQCFGRPKHLYCFAAGDVRANEQTHLTVLHTIYVREHNRIAKHLAQMNVDWDDEKIYQETRHIVAAGVQHVLINEFVPLLLGHKYANEYKLKSPVGTGHKSGNLFWDGYDPSVAPSTGTGFAAAAYRYGHSMIESIVKRFDPVSEKFIKAERLRFLFNRPFQFYEPGAIDQLIKGMLLVPSEQTDPFVSEELSGHLFQPPKAKFGHDLAAINIQRGRDHGVPGYNDWREWCGLSRAKSFDDLEPLLMNRTAQIYSRLFKHVDDIDLWSAGISERKLPGSAVGPTMGCIIARQFYAFKRGDRFWYENPNLPSSFTGEQLREIKKITLAKILCTNADNMPKIQPWAMKLPHSIYNAPVPCESLPSMNLKYWDSSSVESAF